MVRSLSNKLISNVQINNNYLVNDRFVSSLRETTGWTLLLLPIQLKDSEKPASDHLNRNSSKEE
jgi:hypothetical protein